MKMCAFAVLALLVPCGAMAQTASAPIEIPKYDVEAACAQQNSGITPDNSRAYYTNQCIDDEQRDYDYTSTLWGDLTDAAKTMCLSHLQNSALYYSLLANCVQSAHVIPTYLVEQPQHHFQP